MMHLIDQATCERTPLVATLVSDVSRAVCESGGRSSTMVLGRAEAAEQAGLIADHIVPCPRDAIVPGGIGVMKRRLKQSAGIEGPWICWSSHCELLMSLVRAETLRIMPGDAHRACDRRKLAEGEDRQSLRQRWGVGDDQRVALLLCDDPSVMCADLAMVAVGLAAETGRPWRLVMHPATQNAAHAQFMARQMGDEHRIVLDERAAVTWRVIGGCDAAIWAPSAGAAGATDRYKPVGDLLPAAGLSLAWAMLSGVPVVGEPHGWLSEGQTALLAQTGRARSYATWLCRVFDEPAMAAAVGERASAWAARRFAPAQVADWWSQVAG